MKSSWVLLWLALVGMGVAGCGPLQAPLPSRSDAEGQKKIDEAWDNALRPLDRFDHQGLLDILTVTRAYEAGVDKLTFRSEKRTAAGTVVMEIHYDRLAPAEDRFEVQLLDGAGRVLRKERYGRDEVEKTYRDLLVEHKPGCEARIKAVEEVFPKAEEEGKGNPGPKEK